MEVLRSCDLSVEGDWCQFLCVVDEGVAQEVKDRMDWFKYQPPTLCDDEFTFMVSHPHGTAQKVSFGSVTKRNEFSRRIPEFDQIVLSRCVNVWKIDNMKVFYSCL